MEAKIMPGVQYPHCSPCASWNACCIGCHRPFSVMPRIVVISYAASCSAKKIQDLTDSPSSKTVHAPYPEVLPSVVNQQEPRLHLRDVRTPVHRHLDSSHMPSFRVKPRKTGVDRPTVLPRTQGSTVRPGVAVNRLTSAEFPRCFWRFCRPLPFLSDVRAV